MEGVRRPWKAIEGVVLEVAREVQRDDELGEGRGDAPDGLPRRLREAAKLHGGAGR